MLRRLAFLAALLALPSPAAAWWDYGHATVAAIARAEVKPATRAAIDRLLARARLLETPACPARTIEQASVWADCIKTLGDRFSYASSWHYQDIDICKPFDIKADCANGNCVTRQIERMRRLLADGKLPTRDRVEALLFLVHFVGDLHQPLHVGERGDQGGNQVPAAYGYIAGQRTNLHMVWDGLLADRAISTPPADAAGILAQVPPAKRPALAAGGVEDWARESWQIAHDSVYATAFGDPCGPKPEQAMIDQDEIRALIPVVRGQIARGGLRLAKVLDEALGATP